VSDLHKLWCLLFLLEGVRFLLLLTFVVAAIRSGRSVGSEYAVVPGYACGHPHRYLACLPCGGGHLVQRGSVAEVCYVAVCYRVTLPEELGFETLSSFAIVSTYYSCISPPTSKNPSVSSVVVVFFAHAGRKISYARRR
jgi:hypothetical protein